MGAQRQFNPESRRRGSARVVGFCVLAAMLALLSACGDGGGDTETEKASDAETLNAALARERALLDAYTAGNRLLRGRMRRVARELRAHEQEYVDALTKALRGLGADAEEKPAEIDLDQVVDGSDLLDLAYQLESGALAAYVEAAPRLHTDAPRTLAASLAAGHAQHLVLIRQGLGVEMPDAAPEAFDGGEVPAPGEREPNRE